MEVRLPDGVLHTINGGPVRIDSLVTALGLDPLEVIVSVNGRIVPENTMAGGDDRVRITRVAHGG